MSWSDTWHPRGTCRRHLDLPANRQKYRTNYIFWFRVVCMCLEGQNHIMFHNQPSSRPRELNLCKSRQRCGLNWVCDAVLTWTIWLNVPINWYSCAGTQETITNVTLCKLCILIISSTPDPPSLSRPCTHKHTPLYDCILSKWNCSRLKVFHE